MTKAMMITTETESQKHRKAIVGKRAFVTFNRSPKDSVQVEMKIKDVKTVYGRDRYLVQPVAGQGELWVQNIVFA